MSKIDIFFPSSPLQISDRVSDKYSRNLFGLDGNDLLLMRIIDAEEAHLMEWLKAQRSRLDPQIKDGDVLRASSQLFLQGKKWPVKKVNTKKYDDGGLQKYGLFNFFYSKLQH